MIWECDNWSPLRTCFFISFWWPQMKIWPSYAMWSLKPDGVLFIWESNEIITVGPVWSWMSCILQSCCGSWSMWRCRSSGARGAGGGGGGGGAGGAGGSTCGADRGSETGSLPGYRTLRPLEEFTSTAGSRSLFWTQQLRWIPQNVEESCIQVKHEIWWYASGSELAWWSKHPQHLQGVCCQTALPVIRWVWKLWHRSSEFHREGRRLGT